jgi:hypothetical protein
VRGVECADISEVVSFLDFSFYLSVAYLQSLLIALVTKRQMIGRLMHKLERMRKEAIVA